MVGVQQKLSILVSNCKKYFETKQTKYHRLFNKSYDGNDVWNIQTRMFVIDERLNKQK